MDSSSPKAHEAVLSENKKILRDNSPEEGGDRKASNQYKKVKENKSWGQRYSPWGC
jgi:hypothetical protein